MQQNQKNNKLVSIGEFGIVSVFENDPYPLAEIYLETENQVKKFIELVGRPPEYIHMHSVVTPNALQAAIQVAEAYNIYHSSSLMREYQAVPGTFDSGNLSSIESQLEYNVLENLLTRDLPSLKQDETYYFICHGGYVDSDLLQYSSLTLRRALDLATLLDSRLAEYINNEEIELITYRDLAN